MKLVINNDYLDPNNGNVEIIERKGLGHPDSLADMLAKECSRIYSNYCIDHFGCILHHNLDKLYIGGGCFRFENGKVNMYDKIKIRVNGRISNTMNGENIDVPGLLIPVIKEYVGSILPRVDVEHDIDINVNSTQNTQLSNWFSPNSIDDVPDAKELFANDTSLCVSHSSLTPSEKLTLEIEKFFWNFSGKYPRPRFNDIGQDIKVMVSRINDDIDVSICMPVFSDMFKTNDEYKNIIKKYEKEITDYVNSKRINGLDNRKINIAINRYDNGDYRRYALIKGSCIECGEEGVVGRGNNSQGLIPAFRQHTMESPFGKNERYHTGRVLSFIGNNTSLRINDECNIKNSIYCLTRNRNPLMKPFLLYISTDKEITMEERNKIEKIIDEEFNEHTYVKKMLSDSKVY